MYVLKCSASTDLRIRLKLDKQLLEQVRQRVWHLTVERRKLALQQERQHAFPAAIATYAGAKAWISLFCFSESLLVLVCGDGMGKQLAPLGQRAVNRLPQRREPLALHGRCGALAPLPNGREVLVCVDVQPQGAST